VDHARMPSHRRVLTALAAGAASGALLPLCTAAAAADVPAAQVRLALSTVADVSRNLVGPGQGCDSASGGCAAASPTASSPGVADGAITYDSSSSAVHRTGSWHTVAAPRATGGAALMASGSGHKLSISRVGGRVVVGFCTSKAGGIATVTVDGRVVKKALSTYSRGSACALSVTVGNLVGTSPHKVVVSTTGKEGRGGGTSVAVDRFVIS